MCCPRCPARLVETFRRHLLRHFPLLSLPVVGSHIRGIFCDDFLEHFDMLIEHRQKMLCLEDSGAMRAEVRGTHIALVTADRAPGGAPLPAFLIVSARVSDGTPPVRLKLDSGTNAPFLDNSSGHMAPISFGGGSVVGNGADGDEKVLSALPPLDVENGSLKLPGLTACGATGHFPTWRTTKFDGATSILMSVRGTATVSSWTLRPA
jgi:hypothetical protein